MKKAIRLLFFLLAGLGLAKPAASQQLIYTGKSVYNWFQLYEGDRLKITYSGPNKKMMTYFNGVSDPVKSASEYTKRLTTVNDVEAVEWVVTKEGPHNLITFKVKGEGEMKVFRYPAPGKETLPVTLTFRYPLRYQAVASRSPYKRYRKYLAPFASMPFGTEPVAGNYLPADVVLTKKLADFAPGKQVVVYDNEVITGRVALVDSLLHNQRAYGFQKGDTVAYSITYHPKSFDSPNSSYAYVARPDQYFSFHPDQYNGMPQFLLRTESLRKDQPQTGSFIANNDGVFGFYFQEAGKYDVKIVRHPGPRGNPKFTLPIEWGQVMRSDLGLYVEEPIMR